MLCDWARDIYRKEIMKCLASAVSDSRGFTPADSHISYVPFSGEDTDESHSDRERVYSTSPGDFGEHQDEVIVIHSDSDSLTEVNSILESTPDVDIISLDPLTVSDMEMVDPNNDSEAGMTQTEAWGHNVVIRHANNVIFSFQSLDIPETDGDLIRLLASTSTGSDIAHAAGKLVMLFRARNQILTRKSIIRQLEECWTGPDGMQEPSSNYVDDDIVIAHFSFESYFRQDDWELVRKLTCIMASPSAIDKLAQISGFGHPVTNDYMGELRGFKGNFLNVTLSLRNLSYEESAKGAVFHLHLYLRQDYASFERGKLHYEWEKTTRHIRDVLSVLERIEPSITVSTSERRGKVRRPMRNMKFDLHFGSNIQATGAFLAKKQESWPEFCPKYCLVVFDQSDVQDPRAMASKISNAILHQSFFHEVGNGICQADVNALTLWARILHGEAPLDSALPL
jgi:hypothetical protein